MKQVISLTLCSYLTRGAAFLSRPDIQIDEVFLALVDKRRHSSVVKVLESASQQRKPLTGKILNRWSEIELAVEPWLYCVLIGRDHIGAMTLQLQRADVIGNHFLGQQLISGRTQTWHRPPDNQPQHEY